jgi:hypothetical protein
MNVKTSNQREKSPQYIEIRKELLEGKIRALSIDTCIFTYAGYQLEAGNFKQLAQFKNNEIKLIFTDITLREVFTHLAKHSEESKTKTLSALRGCGKFWQVSKEKQTALIADLLGDADSEGNAKHQLSSFLEKCGAEKIESKHLLDVERLLDMYFSTVAPFESSKEKKSEFPDAIALLTLEAWSKINDVSLLLVTNDHGWHRFCEQSSRLYSVSDLGEALTLVQERNVHLAELCDSIDRKIASGDIGEFIKQLSNAVASNLWSIDWSVDADSPFSFEEELYDVELADLHLTGSDGEAELSPVDFHSGALVVRVTVIATVKATCAFSFSMRDGIDRDMVPAGGTTEEAIDEVEIELLLTFENVNEQVPEFVDVEIVPSRKVIHFGTVEPYYGDDSYDQH